VCDVKNDPIGLSESDKKIRLRLPVLSGIRLHPKTSDSLRLRNPAENCTSDAETVQQSETGQNRHASHDTTETNEMVDLQVQPSGRLGLDGPLIVPDNVSH